MTDRNLELTRRKVLGALGVAGAGAALGGAGTAALFNDSETFEGNRIAAGSLDLKVDWEEHYSYPQAFGFDDPAEGLDVTRSEPEEPGDYFGLPDPEDPVVWVHEEDLEDYMANTAIEAFPDPDDNGSQEIQSGDFVYDACEDGADLNEDLDPTRDADARRTQNPDTYDSQNEEIAPLINLEDVKPGDFGELTLSFHLCDNPGYVWLQAGNVSEDENSLTDPESGVDNTPDEPELAEEIQTIWWLDTNGNNVLDASIGEADVMIAVDTSASLDSDDVSDLESAANQLANDLDATGNARVGGLSFGDGSIDDFRGLAGGPVQFSDLSPGGNTPMPAALDIAAAELDANGRQNADTFIVLLTDGGPNYANTTYSAGGHTVGGYSGGTTGDSAVSDSELCETANVAADIRTDHSIITVGIRDDGDPTGNDDPQDCDGNAIPSLSAYLQNYIAGSMADYKQAEDPAAVADILDEILAAIAIPEQVVRRSTLAEDLELLSQGDGIPLDADPGNEESRACFEPSNTHFIGFGWWLPTETGNEVQSDSVSFDLGFYAEQCRNNPDPGTTGNT